MAPAAWCSSANATKPFMSSRTPMITASVQWRTSSDSTNAASIIQAIGPQK